MEGCGRPIQSCEKSNLDHIIPRALFSVVAKERNSEFNEDWNLQPMHVACNNSRGFYLDGWPRFVCRCHYLQVCEGDLYVYTRGKAKEGRHKLFRNVVSDQYDTKITMISGSGTGKGGSHLAGFSKGQVRILGAIYRSIKG